MTSTIGKVSLIGFGLLLASISVRAQARPIELPQMVLTVGHSEIFTPPGSQDSSDIIIIKIQSSNPSVARVERYGANQIQIVAVAPGRTTIEFYNNLTRRQYHQPVWVEATNASGGGGAGFDKTRTQLEQVVMLPKRTHPVPAPGAGPHQLSSVTSSNPSVATARTNTRNTIQIYSIALGDTWVNFTDNASGKHYQVHVWVVNDLKFRPPALPASESKSSSAPQSYPVPDFIKGDPTSSFSGGPVDECLIGSWVSEPLNPSTEKPDGSGILLTIQTTGIMTVDYSGMSPIIEILGSVKNSRAWTGRVIVPIRVTDGAIAVFLHKHRGNTVIRRLVQQGRLIEERSPGPIEARGSDFTCTNDRLTIGVFFFRRKSQ